MIRLFNFFGQVIIMDSTHKVSVNNDEEFWKFFSMIVIDGRGESEAISLFFAKDETIETLSHIFKYIGSILKFGNVNVFMADKDLSERHIIGKFFPHAESQLCDFHIRRVFEKHLDKTQIIKLDSESYKTFPSAIQKKLIHHIKI